MSVKDKLEIGLKPDAPYREDNLPEHQKSDPACQEAGTEGDSPEQQRAREECADEEDTRAREMRRRRGRPVGERHD